MTANLSPLRDLPDWVPSAVRLYLAHTAGGLSLREIARGQGVHASTVLRQVRRFESRRDDPLIDCALGRLQGAGDTPDPPADAGPAVPDLSEQRPEACAMSMRFRPPSAPPTAPAAGAADPTSAAAPGSPPDDGVLLREARRLLPLLAGPEAMMAVAADMDRAVVLRDTAAGAQRLAVLDRPVAEAFALRDWIACRKTGRVAQYVLTAAGRSMLRKLGAEVPRARALPGAGGDDDEGRFRPPPESPVAVLARRRDPDGRPFLSMRMVAAAERLREDFEISQMEPRATQDWDRMMTGGVSGGIAGGAIPGASPAAARARLAAALAELGPGLGDVALRCCCWQEGVETAERHLGWSARSGKVVLRIALDRLARHYEEQGEAGKLIG